MRVRKRLEICLALGADAALAVVQRRGVLHRAVSRLALPPEPEDPTPALVDAFRAIDAQLGAGLGFKVRAVQVRIVLLPPLSDARLVNLPPLKLSEAEAVVRRDVARYFVGATARAVAVQPAQNGFLAAAAPVVLVEAVRTALRVMGWTPNGIVAAHGAWLQAERPGKDAGRRAIVAAMGEAAHVMVRDNAMPVVIRRVPLAMAQEVVEAAGALPGTVTVLGEGAATEKLLRAFSNARWTRGENAAMSAEEGAAIHAGRSRLEFIAPSQLSERTRKAKLSAVRIGLAAAMLLVLAGLAELWGARRELDAVRARRAAIRADVAPLLVMRDSLNQLNERVAKIQELENRSPQWTRALFDLALLLPEDTHLTSLRATADTLIIEASGDRAGEAMQALRRAGSLDDVRMLGAVQRELDDGETSVERFRLRAVLNPLAREPADAEAPEKAGVRATVAAAREVARRPQ
jgi:Tfp pilus assembly protein PilN